jgi:hypothetical protein
MVKTDSPTITLIFKGLFILAFEKENKFCQVGVMRAERHCLRIKIKANGTSHCVFPELPSEILDGDIFIDVSGRAGSVSIHKQKGPFDRDTAKDQRDFRWILDMEGKDLHNQQLSFKAGALKQSIFINNGLFYTYSVQPVLIISPKSSQRHVAVAEQIGCDIYLDDQEEAVLRYGPYLESRIILQKSAGISYTIFIDNDCEELPRSNNSDFVFYYDVIDVPRIAQYKVTGPVAGDPRNPCSPITVGLSKAPLR